ncbi:MAG TPA: hypothetical protein VGD94_05345 [Vicinamibacterales bacterium]
MNQVRQILGNCTSVLYQGPKISIDPRRDRCALDSPVAVLTMGAEESLDMTGQSFDTVHEPRRITLDRSESYCPLVVVDGHQIDLRVTTVPITIDTLSHCSRKSRKAIGRAA